MPTIYKYLGMYFYFYSDEHNPIHVHVKYQGAQCKVEIYPDGRIHISNYLIAKDMDPQMIKKVEKFVRKHKDDIREKWSQFHIYGKKVKPEIITRQVK